MHFNEDNHRVRFNKLITGSAIVPIFTHQSMDSNIQETG